MNELSNLSVDELSKRIMDDFGQADCVYPQDKWDIIEHLTMNYGCTNDDAAKAWENYISSNEFGEEVVEYQPSIYV